MAIRKTISSLGECSVFIPSHCQQVIAIPIPVELDNQFPVS